MEVDNESGRDHYVKGYEQKKRKECELEGNIDNKKKRQVSKQGFYLTITIQ